MRFLKEISGYECGGGHRWEAQGLKTLISKYHVVIADFKTVLTKFVQQGNEQEIVKSYLDKFKKLRDSNKIKTPEEKNIDNWGKKSFSDFRAFVDTLTETKSKTKVKEDAKAEGAKLVAENDFWKVYKILDHKACILYGKNTRWCITQVSHWKNYAKVGYVFYFILSKTRPESDPKHKIALAISLDGSKEIYDATDTPFSRLPASVPKFQIELASIDLTKFLDRHGNFNVSNLALTSLEGSPEKVGGYFDCSDNQLTSLKGAPREVGRDFHCNRNQLTSLKGAPREVGGDFSCSNNQLTSLIGAPEKVRGDFYCSSNKLTSLEGAPRKVGGDFSCHGNKLTSLKGAPKEVGGYFSCHGNKKKFTEAEVRAVCNVKGEVYV